MHVRRRCGHAVYHSRLRVHSDMQLHTEVPLISLLGLAHLRVALLTPVLRRRRGRDDTRVHYRPLLKTKSLRLQMTVNLLQQACAQLVLVQQMTKSSGSSSRPATAQIASDLRIASPTRPRRACLPSPGRSGYRTTARSVSEASSPTHRVSDHDQLWDRTVGCVLPTLSKESDRPCVQETSPCESFASCPHISSRRKLAGPSNLSSAIVLIPMILCHRT